MVKSQAILSHVAFLVPSVERAAQAFTKHRFTAQKPQIWDGEGTKEIYIGDSKTQSALPLLMEPVKIGAYTRALEKRGPGLHHIAVDVLHLEDYIESMAGSGWLLHPKSLRMIRESKTAYLARPGMPALIEVQEREEIPPEKPLIEEIHLHIEASQLALFRHLGLAQVSAAPELAIVMQGQKINFKEMI